MTYVQADIVPAIVTWLGAQDIGGAVAQTNVPETWTTEVGPVLVVEDDGGPALWPIKSNHTIRITAWAAGRSQARQIVSLAAGLLGTGRPDGVGYISRETGGVLDARDKATGAYLASVLIPMVARTVSV